MTGQKRIFCLLSLSILTSFLFAVSAADSKDVLSLFPSRVKDYSAADRQTYIAKNDGPPRNITPKGSKVYNLGYSDGEGKFRIIIFELLGCSYSQSEWKDIIYERYAKEKDFKVKYVHDYPVVMWKRLLGKRKSPYGYGDCAMGNYVVRMIGSLDRFTDYEDYYLEAYSYIIPMIRGDQEEMPPTDEREMPDRESFPPPADRVEEVEKIAPEPVVEDKKKEHRAPKLHLEILQTAVFLKKGEMEELKGIIRVDNDGFDTAKDVMVDLRGAINQTAEVSLSDYMYIGDIEEGRSKKPRNKLYVYAKEIGKTELVFRAVCSNGKPSEKEILKVVVEAPPAKKIPAISERISCDGKPVGKVIVRKMPETAEKEKKKLHICNKGWMKEENGARFSVIIRKGACAGEKKLVAFVNKTIVMKVKVTTKNFGLMFLFQPVEILDITDPSHPKRAEVYVNPGTWMFTKGLSGLLKTPFKKLFEIPMYSFAQRVVMGKAKWDVRIHKDEEVMLVAQIIPEKPGVLRISWDYPYTFSERVYAEREYEGYKHFKGKMEIEVIEEKFSIK